MMSEERSSNAELGEWMVMSLEEGFHAYDKTSGLDWPPKGSTAGLEIHHVWRTLRLKNGGLLGWVHLGQSHR